MRAYVTLVTNRDYALGALALARSLKAVGAADPLIVMATASAGGLDALSEEGARIVAVEQPPLSEELRHRHAREVLHRAEPFTKGAKPDFHDPLDNFCKLRLWQLEGVDKAIFLDADTLVVKSIERLFDYPEFCAAPNVYESLRDFQRLNAGVFVAKPAAATYARMLERLNAPGAFWRRTDQTFLEAFFPDWHGLPTIFNTLQYVFVNLPGLWDWGSIRVLHYQYEKPWQADHPRREQLKPLIDLWRHMLEGGAPPTDLPSPHADGR
jgi:alpha-N-acetylglucosamine transferase